MFTQINIPTNCSTELSHAFYQDDQHSSEADDRELQLGSMLDNADIFVPTEPATLL